MAIDITQTVATPSAAVEKMRPEWELCKALLGGTRAMRDAGQAYLPKWPAEEQVSYAARLAVAVLFPAFARTVETLTGKPFSKQVTLSDDMPEDVQSWMQDVDLEGRNLTTFGADLMTDALGMGLAGILVDYPVVEDQADPAADPAKRTLADEKRLGLRPYWVHIKPGQILGWRVQKHKLLQLRILESIEEDDGEYGTRCVEQVRVLTPGAWETHRKNDKGEWLPYKSGKSSLDFIPFVPIYGKRIGFLEAKPPLVDVAYLNVAHWQSASDQQVILHVARVPILVRIGLQTNIGPDGQILSNELKIGAGSAVDIPSKDGDLKYVEHTGAAIDSGVKDLEALEERMRQAGAELLVIKPGEVTATATATENAVGMCALQRITLGVQDAINLALDYTAKLAKLPSAGTVKLFSDFGAMTLKEASGQLVLSMHTAGVIDQETTINEMKRRGELAADVDPEEVAARLETEGPSLGTMGEVDPAMDPVTGKPKLADSTPAVAASAPSTIALEVDTSQLDAALEKMALAIERAQQLNEAMQQPAQAPAAPAQSDTSRVLDLMTQFVTREQPAPIVNNNITMPEMPVTVNNEGDTINVAPAPITLGDTNITTPPVTVEGSTVNVTPPAVTVEGPTINLPDITVEGSTHNITTPAVTNNIEVQPAAAPEVVVPVTVESPDVTVNAPVTVESAPAPNVVNNVTVERPGITAVKFTEDPDGNLTGAVAE